MCICDDCRRVCHHRKKVVHLCAELFGLLAISGFSGEVSGVQEVFFDIFDLFLRQFSINLPDESCDKNIRKSEENL